MKAFSAYARALAPVFKAGMAAAAGVEPDKHSCADGSQPAECAYLVADLALLGVDLLEAIRGKDYTAALIVVLGMAEKSGADAKMPSWVGATLTFVVELASAKDSDSVQRIIEGAAAPVGSYQGKRGDHGFTLTLTALPGMQGGGEILFDTGLPDAGLSGRVGLFAPIGLDASWGVGKTCSVGLFFSALDLGALVDFRTGDSKSGSTEVGPLPQVGFAQVVSPGAYLAFGLGDTPLVAGIGGSLAPGLRKAVNNTTADETDVTAFRFGAYLAVDVSLFPIVR